MAGLLQAFNASLIRKPMVTQCVTSAVLFGAGDVVAQQVFEKKGANHDFMRTARLSFYGVLFSDKGVIYRVYLDQGVFTPVVVGMFFGSLTLLEGKGFHDAKERIREAYAPTLIRNWGVFIPTQIINFAIVPPHLRFVTVGVVSLFWNAYLSSVNAKKQVAEPAAQVQDAIDGEADAPATEKKELQ